MGDENLWIVPQPCSSGFEIDEAAVRQIDRPL